MPAFRQDLWEDLSEEMVRLDWKNMGGYQRRPEDEYKSVRREYYSRIDREGFFWFGQDPRMKFLGFVHTRRHAVPGGGIEVVALQSVGEQLRTVMVDTAYWIAKDAETCAIIGGHVHKTNRAAIALYSKVGFTFHASNDPDRLIIRTGMGSFVRNPVISRLLVEAQQRSKRAG